MDTAEASAGPQPDHGNAPRPSRILFVGHSSQLSGAELALLEILPGLRDSGLDCALCLAVEGPVATRARNLGFPVTVLDLPDRLVGRRRGDVNPILDPVRLGPDVLAAARGVARAIDAHGSDLVCAFSMKAFVFGSLGARLAGVPLVWDVHDIARAPYLTRRAAAVFHVLLALMRPRSVLVHSQAVAASLGRRNRLEILPNAVDSKRRTAPVAARGPLRLGMAARLTSWKGQAVAIEAMARVVAALPDARLVLAGAPLFGAGDEAYARGLTALAERLGLAGSVEFVGHVPDPVAFYESVDIALQCSTAPEPFGITVLDAMVAGRPVLVSAHGGVVELVTGSAAGVAVPPGDADALAAAILRLAAEGRPALRARGEAGRLRAARYDVQMVAPRLAQFYEAVARPGAWRTI